MRLGDIVVDGDGDIGIVVDFESVGSPEESELNIREEGDPIIFYMETLYGNVADSFTLERHSVKVIK